MEKIPNSELLSIVQRLASLEAQIAATEKNICLRIDNMITATVSREGCNNRYYELKDRIAKIFYTAGGITGIAIILGVLKYLGVL